MLIRHWLATGAKIESALNAAQRAVVSRFSVLPV